MCPSRPIFLKLSQGKRLFSSYSRASGSMTLSAKARTEACKAFWASLLSKSTYFLPFCRLKEPGTFAWQVPVIFRNLIEENTVCQDMRSPNDSSIFY
jgi:hypothetical protein